jgi:PhoPQ-activated pathogenicity-related protein
MFPMSKATLQILKAVSEFGESAGILEPDAGHVLFGASKRGWLTWMVGAADS